MGEETRIGCEGRERGTAIAARCEKSTYIVEMRFHMYEREGLLKENNEHAAGDAILVEPVFVHVGFLGENKLGMLEAYHRSLS